MALQFLRSQGIRTIYLYADIYWEQALYETRVLRYRQLIQRLHGKGVRVYTLLGSAYLHTEEFVLPERRADALAMFSRVLTYNAAPRPVERRDSVNLDIEPYT